MVKGKTKTQKSRKKQQKIVVDKQISKLSKTLEVVWIKYKPNGSEYLVYKNIPIELLVDETTEKGRKVMVSIYPAYHDVYLVDYQRPGIKSFPFGGIKIYNRTLGESKYVYPEAVVKHKDVQYYNRIVEDFD